MIIPFIAEPSDGWESFEKILLRDVVLSLYKRLDNPLDKFILIAIHEAGYTQEEVGIIVGLSQAAINTRIQEITLFLRTNKPKVERIQRKKFLKCHFCTKIVGIGAIHFCSGR